VRLKSVADGHLVDIPEPPLKRRSDGGGRFELAGGIASLSKKTCNEENPVTITLRCDDASRTMPHFQEKLLT
jgi:hypothetical protein